MLREYPRFPRAALLFVSVFSDLTCGWWRKLVPVEGCFVHPFSPGEFGFRSWADPHYVVVGLVPAPRYFGSGKSFSERERIHLLRGNPWVF